MGVDRMYGERQGAPALALPEIGANQACESCPTNACRGTVGVVRRALAAFLLLVFACTEPYAARPATTSGTPASASTSPPTTASTAAAEPQPEALPRAGVLQYVEIVLGGAKPDDRLPMIVAVHGLGDDPRNFAHLFDTFTEPTRLILPQGIDAREEGGWSWFPLRARDPDIDALAQGIGSAADVLAESIRVLVRERPTVGKPILTGFSQGGMLGFAVAVRHPDVVGLVLPVGGWLPPPLQPTTSSPKGAPKIVAFHGTADAAVKYEPTKQGVDSLRAHGWDASLVTYEGVGHMITPELHRDLFDRIVDGLRAAPKGK
jgi:phospholipase/carboxylesterase